jgi:hypothetical protein
MRLQAKNPPESKCIANPGKLWLDHSQYLISNAVWQLIDPCPVSGGKKRQEEEIGLTNDTCHDQIDPGEKGPWRYSLENARSDISDPGGVRSRPIPEIQSPVTEESSDGHVSIPSAFVGIWRHPWLPEWPQLGEREYLPEVVEWIMH